MYNCIIMDIWYIYIYIHNCLKRYLVGSFNLLSLSLQILTSLIRFMDLHGPIPHWTNWTPRKAGHSTANDAVNAVPWVYLVYFSLWPNDSLMISTDYLMTTNGMAFVRQNTVIPRKMTQALPGSTIDSIDRDASAGELRTTHGHKKPWPEPWGAVALGVTVPGSWFGVGII